MELVEGARTLAAAEEEWKYDEQKRFDAFWSYESE